MLIRASIGTLIAAGELDAKTLVRPGVAYLLQYSDGGCSGGCLFCAQSSRSVASKEFLSRVVWPAMSLEDIAPKIARVFRRACVQSIIKPNFVEELHEVVKTLSQYGLKVSLSTSPMPDEDLKLFKREGVDYLGIGLDAATPSVATKVNKPYPYSVYLDFIDRAISVFGRGKVVVHLIIGIGETLMDALETIKQVYSMGGRVSLFAFTPVKGTPAESWSRPSLRYYRMVQVINYMISNGLPVEELVDLNRVCVYVDKLRGLGEISKALLTSGCPECNRPYYTESPREEPYNFPAADLLPIGQELLRKLSCDVS
ncbi:MAG: radical SAM protein [Sulfolobales archaeon]